MDNRFGEMQIFMAVAQHGSFVAAARALRMTPSAVSRAIARLEKRIGVQLARRTTRALALTTEGEAYRQRIAGLIGEIDDIERSFGPEREPRGLLRVNASVAFGMQCLVPILPRYMALYPAVTIDLTLSEAIIELVEDRADIALRVGPLRSADIKAKKLGRSTMALVASPDYLDRHGTPRHPRDLDDHVCLRFNFRRSVDSWPFLVDGRTVHRSVDGPFMGNSGELVRELASQGGGLARLGRFHVAADLKAGRLVEVLADFNPGDGEDIHALYAPHERLAQRVRSFLDFLGDQLTIQI